MTSIRKHKISCVFFDVYDTLASLGPIIAGDLARYNRSPEEFAEYIAPYATQADHGEISFIEYQKKYSAFFGKSYDYLPLHLLPRLQPIKEMHALVGLLDCLGVPMGIISDVSPNALRQTISSRAVPYVNFFSIIESNKHGKRKSNGLIEEATSITTAKLGIAPGEILLIDDSMSNVEIARSHGWSAFQFDPHHPRTSMAKLLHTFSLFN
jgi:FMN phosphatase YigB (HAD superfamily)